MLNKIYDFATYVPCDLISSLLIKEGWRGIYKLSRLEWSVAKRVEGLSLFLFSQGMDDRASLLLNHAIQEDAHARLLESWLESRGYPVDRMRREGGLLFLRSDKTGSQGHQYPTSIHLHPLVRLFLSGKPLGDRDYREQLIAYGYLERLASQVYKRLASADHFASKHLFSILIKIAADESNHASYLHSIKWDCQTWDKAEWSLIIPFYHVFWFILSILGIWGVALWELFTQDRQK